MSSPARPFHFMSLDDFEEHLADRPENERWELLGGRVVKMMVGARWEHKQIVVNIMVAMANDFRKRGSSCRPFDETFFLKDRGLDLAALPDVMVVCHPLEKGDTSVADPTVLIEVVSPGSEARDRVEKWHLYQALPSLRHYVLVSRDKFHVEVFDRVDGAWSGLRMLDRPEAELALPAIDFTMSLGDIYRDVLAA